MAPHKFKRYFSGVSKNTAWLACASLFADISTEMLYPVLPVFLTQTLHASGAAVGLIEGLAQATQNIAQGFSGWLADKLHRHKSIALAGYTAAAVAKPLIGLSTGWPGVLGARFLDRFGSGVRSAPRDAMVAASVDEPHRGKAFGLEGIGDNAGAFIGPLLAVLLLYTLHVGIRSIFTLALIPGLLAVLMIALVKTRPDRTPTSAKIKLARVRLPAAYWKYLLATAVFGIGNASNSFLILQTQDIGASLETTILVYAAFNLVAALISYPAGFLSDRIGRRNLLLAAFGVFCVTCVGFAITRNFAVIAALFVGYGLYQGTFRAVGKALASDLVPHRQRASGIGWYSTTVGLSGLVASIVAGLLWDHIGHAAVFIYAASFALVGGVALWILTDKPPRPGGA